MAIPDDRLRAVARNGVAILCKQKCYLILDLFEN